MNRNRDAHTGPDKPTVLIVGPTPPPIHGVSVLIHYILNSKLSESFRLVHLDTSDRRPMDNAGRFDLRNAYLAVRHGLTFWWLMLRHRPQVVLVPVSQTGLGLLRDSLFMIPTHWLGGKLVIQLHGSYFATFYQEANLLTRGLARWSLRKVDLALVLADKFRNIFLGLVPEERIAVVSNGIPDELGEAAKSFGAEPRSTLRVVLMATMMESKGFIDLLRAIPDIACEVPNVEVVFVGDGSGFPEYEQARLWARENHLEGYAKFVGPRWGVDKVRTFLDADVFTFPTWYPYEGQPVVLLEAMAAGLPIVTTRHAANEDTLGDDGTLYVESRNPKDLAAKLIRLLKDPELRTAMGRRNRERFLTGYSLDCLADNLASAFVRVLEPPGLSWKDKSASASHS